MHVVILGNGVAGVSAALRLREKRPDWRITIVSGESKYHYSRPALMYVFMGHMRYEDTKPFEDSFWDEQRLELVRAWVTRIDTQEKRLELHGQDSLAYDKLLVATGSKPNKFDWPGQELDGVQGLWGLYDLKRLYESARTTRRAVVVGGGLIGIELAEMLHSRGIHVTILAREDSYWGNVLPREEAEMVGRVIREQGIDLRLRTELKEIVDDGSGRCRAVITGDGEELPAQIVGLTAGVSPNIGVVEGSDIETGRGVLVDDSLRTSVPDVLAAGDCAEIRRPEGERNVLQQVWYTGKMQGEVAGDVLAGEERSYRRGTWFNSAKFFDLEYQTYGQVGFDLPGERHVYWEAADGRHAIRIVHDGERALGFNVMGLRWRHAVCERWLEERRPLEHVLEHLAEANFDPEFFRRFESEATATFRRELVS